MGEDVEVELGREIADLLGGRSIGTAESCTAGRVAEALAGVEQATEFLRGGIVAYQEQVKRAVLGVAADSVLTERAAAEMALGATRVLACEVAVATTGVAGGEEQEGTPPGTVYVATVVDGDVWTAEHRFHGSPGEICDRACRQALVDLAAHLRRR